MKSMKKLLINLLAAAMLLSTVSFTLAACNGEGGTTTEPPTTPPVTTAPAEEEELPTTYADKSKLVHVKSLDAWKKTDWTAKWIWSGSSQKNSYVAFRKTFTLDGKPSKAVASIAAENKYYLWVNGALVVYDGEYKRGPTMVDTYYEEIDLADYLVKGENTIVALVNYFGRSGTSSANAGEAGFLFEMDCGGKKIVSDKTFKAQRLTAYKNDRLLKDDYPDYPQYEALAEWNCYYDARDSVGDFTSPSYDDSSWKNASVVANVGTEPFNDTYLCVSPMFAFDKEYTDLTDASKYLNQKFTEKTTIDIDMGTNVQFSPYFELNAESEGLRITYYTDTYITSNLGSFKDDYVTKKGVQSYESYPWRTGKHLIIEVPAGVTFTKIAVRRSGFDTEQTGSFASSNETLNTLWQRAANTVKICMRDTYMDCPERERSPWAGDVANMVAETLYSYDENATLLIKKTILSVIGWVQDGTNTGVDNVIPLRVPCMKVTEWAAQDLAFFHSVFEYYLYTGDAETVKLFYPVAKNYLKLWSMEENGLVKYRASDSTWADWGVGFVDEKLIQQCQYYMALSDALVWAKDFGETADIEFYQTRMDSMKKAFRSAYLKEGGFTSGTEYDDRANAMAVLSGLADKEDYPIVLNVLQNVENCSVYMERHVEEALCIMGAFDTATSRTERRYATMLASEYDTLWERFDIFEDYSDGSPNHGWAGGPLVMLSKYYAGVRPTSAGYATYEITPSDALDSFTCTVPTPKGEITVSFESKDGGKTIVVSAVEGEGTVRIPVAFGEISASENATFLKEEDGFRLYRVGAGTYTFTVS